MKCSGDVYCHRTGCCECCLPGLQVLHVCQGISRWYSEEEEHKGTLGWKNSIKRPPRRMKPSICQGLESQRRKGRSQHRARLPVAGLHPTGRKWRVNESSLTKKGGTRLAFWKDHSGTEWVVDWSEHKQGHHGRLLWGSVTDFNVWDKTWGRDRSGLIEIYWEWTERSYSRLNIKIEEERHVCGEP